MAESIRSERVRANGLDFHVNVCGEGERLALCLHGFPELGYSWRHQLPLLAALGYRAWAPDLRGYGRTERPSGPEAYAIENLMEDVAGLIDASGARQTILIAHDWGAIIAWFFAAHRIRELDRLVILNGPAPGVRRPGLLEMVKGLRRFWYVLFFQIPRLPEGLLSLRGGRGLERAFRSAAANDWAGLDEKDLRVYLEAALAPGALTAMIDYYRAMVRGGGFRRMARRGFPPIEVPTLTIFGVEDPILIPSTLDGAETQVRDLTKRFVPDAGHWVQQEAPEVVNGILAAWLTGEPVPDPASQRVSSDGSPENGRAKVVPDRRKDG